MIKHTRRNYYLALRFKEHDDLHMTLKYFKDLSAPQLSTLIEMVDIVVQQQTGKVFELELPVEGWFGYNQTVRALEPSKGSLPEWVYKIAQPNWVPHVTTQYLTCPTLTITHVALMHKKEEITSWELYK